MACAQHDMAAESPDLKLGPVRKRKRSLLTAQLRPDFVRPAGPGDLPWAWRLADTLSSPREGLTKGATGSECKRPSATCTDRSDSATKRQNVEIDWAPFFREGDERTLPEKLIFEKNALPWAWRLPFTCEP